MVLYVLQNQKMYSLCEPAVCYFKPYLCTRTRTLFESKLAGRFHFFFFFVIYRILYIYMSIVRQ